VVLSQRASRDGCRARLRDDGQGFNGNVFFTVCNGNVSNHVRACHSDLAGGGGPGSAPDRPGPTPHSEALVATGELPARLVFAFALEGWQQPRPRAPSELISHRSAEKFACAPQS